MQYKINDIMLLEDEIAVKWDDNHETYISLKTLRDKCPCAFCSGEKDVFGNVYKGPKKELPYIAYKINNFKKIGHYAIRFFWNDNHSDGLYTYNLLRTL